MFALLRPSTVALLLIPWITASAGTPLTLAEVERLALAHDVTAPQMEATAEALREQGVAAGQLPDPKLTLGMMNLPTDTFSRAQEPMTQLAVGVSQAIPPGETLRYQSERVGRLAESSDAEAQERRQRALRETRLSYLELYYQEQALGIVQSSNATFKELVDISTSLYRVGRNKLQDVLRAQLELGLLEDRETRLRAERDVALAALQRLTGPLSRDISLVDAPTQLRQPPAYAELENALQQHPLLTAAEARVAAGQSAVDVAREQYKPGLMLGVTYGDRIGDNANGSARADFLSAAVTLDLPLFTGKRQDRRLAASIKEVDAQRYQRDDLYFELQRQAQAEYPRWQRLAERVEAFDSRILPAARNNAEAALTAYQNDAGDFTTLMRAYLTEFDSRLQAERTRVDYAQTQARLLYLAGEIQ